MLLDQWIEQAGERLRRAVADHGPAVFTSSFGIEDMVLLDLITRLELLVQIVTLDTGRLHEETYALIDTARKRYGRPIRTIHPDAAALESFVTTNGVNAFYERVALRQRCCEIRKVEPLQRALAGSRLWITGLRRAQSVTRADAPWLEQDGQHGVMKLNPLVEWTTQQVHAYITTHDVPVNALHAKGFPSIGCAPCTRAVQPGEDDRAGRWWWEQSGTRECGLHVGPEGRLVRTRQPESV